MNYMKSIDICTRDEDKGWGITQMICELCTKMWQAVYPIECKELECPNCSKMNEIK